jgi:putative ABC transport system permease protein
VVRTSGDPLALASFIRAAMRQVDPDLPVSRVQTLEQLWGISIAPQRFNVWLFGSFAALALLLAAIGIYGVMAYNVAQRTREIGIRMAMGARRSDVLRLVLTQSILPAATGVFLGLSVALALTRLMASLLFGLTATDPATFAVVALLLILVALAATYLPARRATQVDPLVALRYE